MPKPAQGLPKTLKDTFWINSLLPYCAQSLLCTLVPIDPISLGRQGFVKLTCHLRLVPADVALNSHKSELNQDQEARWRLGLKDDILQPSMMYSEPFPFANKRIADSSWECWVWYVFAQHRAGKNLERISLIWIGCTGRSIYWDSWVGYLGWLGFGEFPQLLYLHTAQTRWRNIPNPSQPNPTVSADGPPCSQSEVSW